METFDETEAPAKVAVESASGALFAHAMAKDTPARSVSMRKLLERYDRDIEMKAAFDGFCHGAGLRVLAVSLTQGIVLSPRRDTDSPFSGRLSWIVNANLTGDNRRDKRIVRLGSVLAIVATAYPSSSTAGGMTGQSFSVANVVETMNAAKVATLAAFDPEEEGQEELHETLARAMDLLPVETERKSTASITDQVRMQVKDFVEAGLLAKEPPTAEGVEIFQPTWRLSVIVRDCAKEVLLNKLREAAASVVTEEE